MELIVHYLCPFALRALYAKNYKGIECEVTEADLINKPAKLRQVSPLGKVPALIIPTANGPVYLFESLQVAEYFDSFPGPPLYPRTPTGDVDPLQKAQIDAHISIFIDGWVSTLFQFLREPPTTANRTKSFRKLKVINDKFLSSGQFFMTNVTGYADVTLADIALYPFVERLAALRHLRYKVLLEGDFAHLWAWYERMSNFDWIQRSKNPEHRYLKIYEMIDNGTYRGLTLPLSIYDAN